MSAGSLVLLPSATTLDRVAFVDSLADGPWSFLDVDLPVADRAPLPTRICGHLQAMAPSEPLLLIAPAPAIDCLPAVALAQRTAHRLVAGYLLIDPADAPVGSDWPDAPVDVIITSGVIPRWVELRGWQPMTTARSDGPEAVALLARAWALAAIG